MKNLLLVASCWITFSLLAQPDMEQFPDFTETDINGVEHSLYADYLDQGKTVVIDIFTTWCPNCVNSLPGLHELEDLYGDNIVLLSFERDSGTSNEASWAETWGVSNPIFANSLSTMETWNTEYQPNFFVICPDGSFELKVGAIGGNPAPLDEYAQVCLDGQADNIKEAEKVEFTITSNPVLNVLEFNTNLPQGKYTVVNLTGQQVLKGKFENKQNSLDATSLETGLYFLKLEVGNSSSVKKFIKN